MENNIEYYTIGYNGKVKYKTEREAIDAMNANPNQELEDIFGYNDGMAILEIEMNVVGNRFMVFGGFYI